MQTARVIIFEEPVQYADGVRLQESLVAQRIAGDIPDTVVFLEHRPVVTLGSRGNREHLRVAEEELARRGVDLAHASRGGDVTYHAPGQLVMYPILQLGSAEADAHGYLCNLEEVAIRTAADFGVAAVRRKGKTGAWTERGKIAAIGVRFKRWVSFHGMSFNVNPDLRGFEFIVPCGLVGEPVTSLAHILGDECPPLAAVRDAMAARFEQVCGRRIQAVERRANP
jgi:lipoate-protein ligase B